MVRGIQIFRQYFEVFPDNYIIIGGTACDIVISEAGRTPRATKDIDIILVVEALSADFVKQFWQFIKDGNYSHNEINPDDRKYYRFTNPEKQEFPLQIELFSRLPDLIELPEGMRFTPVPVDEGLSSLSAILLNEDYYNYIVEHCTVQDGLNLANIEALICFKAIAWLEMTDRKQRGEKIDADNIKKHKTDIFRLAAMLTAADIFELPEVIKADMQQFVMTIKTELPDKAIFRNMGLGNLDVKAVYAQLCKNFNLNAE